MNALRWKVASAPFAPRPDYPGMQPSSAGDATHAIWQDPSSYNPYKDGPPYLPGLPFAQLKTASADSFALTHDYASLLVALRALGLLHQSHHWLTKGENFYQDHLLFERLYNSVVVEIDRVGERAIGLGAHFHEMSPRVQAAQVAKIITELCGTEEGAVAPHQQFVATSLKAEQLFLDLLSRVKSDSAPSIGTDNLLGDLGDTHEEHIYLLQQRSKLSSASSWKAG